jgi:hypothetical protein
MTTLSNLPNDIREQRPAPRWPLLKVTLLALTILFFAWCGARIGQFLAFPGSTWLGLLVGVLFGVGAAVDEMELRRMTATPQTDDTAAGPALTGREVGAVS